MLSRCGLRCGWARLASLLGLVLAAGCAGEPAQDDQAAEPVPEIVGSATVEETSQDSTAGTLRRFLPDAMRRSTRAETFAHAAHVQIDCAVCHQVSEGHGTHGSVECADCHRASAMATMRVLRPEQCAACHHAAEQPLACENCHETRPSVASEQRLALEVWSAPRTRTFTFEHEIHAALDCASCHRAAPMLSPAEPCASCHTEHHTVTARCVACHTPPAEGAHDVESHLTCSGAGCHSAPDVEAIADTRAVCVVCHQAQEEHEPEGNCIECHRVRPDLQRRDG